MMLKFSALAAVVAAHNWDEKNAGSDTLKVTATDAIVDLSNEVRNEQKENNAVANDLNTERMTVDELHQELMNQNMEGEALQTEEDALKNKILELLAEGDNLNKEFNQAKEKGDAEIAELDGTMQKLSNEIDELEVTHAGVITDHEEAIMATFNELSETSESILVQEDTIEKLEEGIREAENRYAEAMSCNMEADMRVEDANAAFEDMNTIFAIDQETLNNEITLLGTGIGETEETINNQEEELSGLRSEIQAMSVRAENIPEAVTYQVQEIFNEFNTNLVAGDLKRRLMSATDF